MDGQVPIVEAKDAVELLVPENDDLIPETEKINSITEIKGSSYSKLGCFMLPYALFKN